MKNLYLIAILICGFSLTSRSQTITGKVIGETAPLAGANIKVEGKSDGTTAASDGSFELKLAAGTYQLQVSYVGYITTTQKVNLVENQTVNLTINLSPTANMQEVVVVSSRKPTKISEIPGTVWVVDGAKIQEQARAGVPFKQALAQLIPSLDAGPEGRTNYGQNQRGRDALVMIDGVSLNSTRGVSRQFESIDPFNIERIEVLSGASAVYGGGATGGIINIITKKGQNSQPSFTTQMGVRSGLKENSDHDVRVAQSISGGNKDWNGRIGMAFQKNNAAYGADGKQIFTDITQTDLQYNQSFDLFGSSEFKLTDFQKLTVNAQYFNSGFRGDKDLFLGANYGGLLSNPTLLEMRNGYTSDVNPKTSRANINVNYQASEILGGQTLYVQAAARNEQFSFHAFPGQAAIPGVLYSGSSVQNTNYKALKLVLNKDWDRLNLTYGIDADNESFDAQQVLFDRTKAFSSGGLNNTKVATIGRYPNFRVNGLSGFAQAQVKVTDFLTLSGGVRQQRMFVKVNDFVGVNAAVPIAYGVGRSATAIPGGENHYDVNLLNGGLVLKISEPQQIWFNFSQGFNLADPAKYYGQGTYTLAGTNYNLVNSINVDNNPLTGIKTEQYEAGYRYRKGIFNAQVAGFYALSDKNVKTNSTFNIEVFDENVRNIGIEGSLSLNLKSGFEAGVNGLYIKTQKENTDGSWSLQDVSVASPSKMAGYIGYTDKVFGLKAQAFHSFDSKGIDSKLIEHQLKGYTTLDLLASAKLFTGSLSFGVQNLLNKDYQTIWSQRSQYLYAALAKKETFYYAGRGRTYNITYTINY
ncbi:TonB-dependent receptor [Pedobacter duraquae]|uniref:Ferric aerobactin receptor n=1 Tax=Pedobacter duraquae TaxID=425511 RepID=A0A4R6INL8_9SPHI|nr:TonB-dependent receptor [Pedobacter duraquae]TDO23832.1 iron complex outermembrane receptor protein [Pedobacter duraquae]